MSARDGVWVEAAPLIAELQLATANGGADLVSKLREARAFCANPG